MTDSIDLAPAARTLATLVRNVTDDQLGDPTPCPAYCVGDLLDHIGGLAVAFRLAATKESLSAPDQTASGDATRLGDDWRQRIPAAVEACAAAWADPAAWTGMTKAGPVEMPGEIGGLVALDELVVHGWDLAVSTGQPYDADEASVRGAQQFVAMFSGPGTEDQRGDAFGPEVPVAHDAPALDRLLGMTGRDAAWRPPAR